MPLRFWKQMALGQVYVGPSQLHWHTPHTRAVPSHFQCLLMARQAPDQGKPEQECGLVPVQQAMFEHFFHEISPEEAARLDPRLVDWMLTRVQSVAGERLHRELSTLPGLYLIVCAQEHAGVTFDVYGDPAPALPLAHKVLLPLTDLLVDSALVPTALVDERMRVLIPQSLCAGNVRCAAHLLSYTLATAAQGEEARFAVTIDW